MRLRNRTTGVIVDVADDLAERLESEWEQAPARAQPDDEDNGDEPDAYSNWTE